MWSTIYSKSYGVPMRTHSLRLLCLTGFAVSCATPPAAEEDPALPKDHPFHTVSDGSFTTISKNAGIGATFSPSGVALRGTGWAKPTTTLKLRFTGWGREGELTELDAVPPTVQCALDTDSSCIPRVEFPHGNITEWWINQPLGLEQGWDIAEAPEGDGPLVLALSLDNGSIQLQHRELAVFTTADGARLHYAHPIAIDAEGRSLPTWFDQAGDDLQVRVDDANATWPIVVDPLAFSPTNTLTSANVPAATEAAGSGDFNNDGYGDLVLGFPSHDGNQGLLLTYAGSASGLPNTTTSPYGTMDATQTLRMGAAIAIGNFNNDAYDDQIISNPLDSIPGPNRGSISVNLGSTNGIQWPPQASMAGASSGDEYGSALAAGDFDGDGYDDVAIGAYKANSDTGYVQIMYGGTTGIDTNVIETLSGTTAGDKFGSALAATNVNGDAYTDLIVGIPGPGDGILKVYHGGASGLSASPQITLTAPLSSSTPLDWGTSIAGGDVDGDGYGDVLVVERNYTNGEIAEGFVALYRGSSGGVPNSIAWSNEGNNPNALLDQVAIVGDTDNNGTNEFVVTVNGGVRLFSGSTNPIPTRLFSGVFRGFAAGDVNGDGFDDLAIDANDFYIYAGGVDQDGDGYIAGVEDCHDGNNKINPGVSEGFNDGVDQNCDGYELCYQDSDNDQHGTNNTVLNSALNCNGTGASAVNDDCADTNPSRFPGATEIPANGVDNNCDNLELCYVDSDGDTFGTTSTTSSSTLSCKGTGISPNDDDCNDATAAVSPLDPEIAGNGLDENCDGFVVCYLDSDSDGFGTSFVNSADADCTDTKEASVTGDCNDTNGAVYPGATEVPADGVDSDCTLSELCFVDADGDSMGSSDTVTTVDLTCSQLGQGHAAISGDCNDNDDAVFPNAPENPWNLVDDNCNGVVACLVDADSDGFGNKASLVNDTSNLDADCSDAGESTNAEDCNDTDVAINPNATETPANGIDQDCDGDELCYFDADADGFGRANLLPMQDLSCITSLTSDNADDCDDVRADVFPGGTEITGDGLDGNCDGFEQCFVDDDHDGYGTSSASASPDSHCTHAGLSYETGDCDDGNSDIHPDAFEVPGNEDDEDCNTTVLCYEDQDGDGTGADTVVASLNGCSGVGVALESGDCDDLNEDISPWATEVPGDLIDQDCDGFDDCFLDADLDGYGAAIAVANHDADCKDVGESNTSDDCAPANPNVHPLAVETPGDEIDGNCDGLETCFEDLDGDGYRSNTTRGSADLDCDDLGNNEAPASFSLDCNDGASGVHPGAIDDPGDSIDQDCSGSVVCFLDQDGDDYGSAILVAGSTGDCTGLSEASNASDCNDLRADSHPGAQETAGNALDEDCDQKIACYLDGDADGFGGSNLVLSNDLDCSDASESNLNTDCDDTHSEFHPFTQEIPGNDVDEDCSGDHLCYTDADADGYGSKALVALSTDCDAGGAAYTSGDCNDGDDQVHPTAVEVIANNIDEDCDGKELCFFDIDGDTFGSGTLRTSIDSDCIDPLESDDDDDCAPANPMIYPGASEIPGDHVDQDCDLADDCFADDDGDGFAGTTTFPGSTLDCSGADEWAESDDCDDLHADVSPAESEICNSTDDDCDGLTDETGGSAHYFDADSDGYGGNTVSHSCNALPHYVDNSQDCNDNTPLINPGIIEVCGDTIDLNCDGSIGYQDADGDSYTACEECNDNNVHVNPSKSEVCNGIDDDCSGQIDGADAVDISSWFADLDGDGHGDPNTEVVACVAPNGFDATGDDCDDDNDAIHTGADEPDCNNPVDYNCDGSAGPDDADNDGVVACYDCDDSDPTVNPGADEVCNGEDDDCDGDMDEQAIDTTVWFPDADGDGFGSEEDEVDACISPQGYTAVTGDCDDTRPDFRPGAAETDCTDSNDYNCDGSVGYADADDDGSPACEDCDDQDDAVSPNTEETCNGQDDDCDGIRDDGFPNTDGDGAPDCLDPDDDNDGVFDTTELANGTDPLDPDSNGDGTPDGTEAIADTNACNTTGSIGAFPLLAAALATIRRRRRT